MPNSFDVSVLSLDEIHSLAGDWDNEALRKVLALSDADDIGDIAEEDLEDICLMSLQDEGNQRAAEIVLEAVFDDSMRPGVRQNILHRLYGGELKQGEFTEASGLIWQAEMVEEPAEGALTRTIIMAASSNLFNSLQGGQQFKAVV